MATAGGDSGRNNKYENSSSSGSGSKNKCGNCDLLQRAMTPQVQKGRQRILATTEERERESGCIIKNNNHNFFHCRRVAFSFLPFLMHLLHGSTESETKLEKQGTGKGKRKELAKETKCNQARIRRRCWSPLATYFNGHYLHHEN